MEPVVVVSLVVLGVVVGAAAALVLRRPSGFEGSPDDVSAEHPATDLLPGVSDVLAVLRSSAVVVDDRERVVKASAAAYAFGLVRGADLVHTELRLLARQVRRDGLIREEELELARGPLGRGQLVVHARVAPLGESYILLLMEDRTESRRIEEVRRDFVANVSHELKTPVGALSLLAEASQDAADDPEAVRHFAKQMQRESRRLSALVQEIIDLSRLQAAEALNDPEAVDLDDVVSDAVDRCRFTAEARSIDIVTGGDPGAVVFGDHELLVTAVRNLVDNAVAYSEPDTRVAVSVSRAEGLVEVAVTDQGVGIPESDLDRVFERFYRVDPARSRITGGTGLGLSIVKHVCANHGGEVAVWSVEGQGSTFTIRLPDSIPARAQHLPTGEVPTPLVDPGVAPVPHPASSIPTGDNTP